MRRTLVLLLAVPLFAGNARSDSNPAFSLAPHVTGFSPAGGPPGTIVTVRGTTFTAVQFVRFNGRPSTSTSTIGDTAILAQVPSGATTGRIAVTTSGGTDSSASMFFVGSPPVVAGFSPGGGGPGTTAVISGTNLLGSSAVRFNGSDAGFTVNSNIQITATVPNGATTGRIAVTNPAGTGLSSSNFYLPPQINGFFPGGGPWGTEVRIFGADLATTYEVRFNGTSVSPSSQSDGEVIAYVPGGATAGPIQVFTSGGNAISTTPFFVGDPPSIANFAPAGGPMGTQVTMTGVAFTGTSLVEFNGTAADSFRVDSDQQITAFVPSGATTGPIGIQNPAGASQSASPFFVGQSPVVATFSPPFAPVGTLVVISGDHFVGVSSVRFGSIEATFQIDSPTHVSTSVPNSATSALIHVTNPAGTGTSATTFGVAPSVTSFSPSCIRSDEQAGTVVTILGSNFTGTTSVSFNSFPESFALISDERIAATLGSGDVTGPISVTTPYGTAIAASDFGVIHIEPPVRGPASGWPFDPAVNVPATRANGTQLAQGSVSDGVGGVIVVWQDGRNGNWDIYAQRINRYGAVADGWPINGLPVCMAPGDQTAPVLTADDVGGALVSWQDSRTGDWDIYLQNVNGNGSIEDGWPTNGLPICTAASGQTNPTISPDGSCGAIVAWQDGRTGGWDLYATRILASSVRAEGWPQDGAPICTIGNTQQFPVIASDRAGGAVIAWEDYRSGCSQIYVQRVDGAAQIVGGSWQANGRQVAYGFCYEYNPRICSDGLGGAFISWEEDYCTRHVYVQHVSGAGTTASGWAPASGIDPSGYYCWYQTSPAVSEDGSGGVLVAWQDQRNYPVRIYAQRISGDGSRPSGWSANGTLLTTSAYEQISPRLCADGFGGCLVAWEDHRSGSDIYAQRLTSAGTTAPSWPSSGAMVSTAVNSQLSPIIVPSDPGRAIIAWQDVRSGDYDIYTQLLDGSGKLGDPAPLITSIRDISGDQGGRVRIQWQPSYLDSMPTLEVAGYGIWRQVDASAAAGALAKGGKLWTEASPNVESKPGTIRVDRTDSGTTYWEGAGSIFARGQDTYSFVAETFRDSTPASNPRTIFMVDAHASQGPYFWDSPVDSGYSVDNLPPGAPLAFSGQYSGSVTHLYWNPSADSDFWNFRLYRGANASFQPNPANLIATQSETGYDDPAGGYAFYKLASVDLHGNQSAFAAVGPGLLDADTRIPAKLSLSNIEPNPLRGAGIIRFGLPRVADVRLALFDAAGRLVREIENGRLAAGEHSVRWDAAGSDETPLASGLYFLRLDAENRTFTRRVAVLH